MTTTKKILGISSIIALGSFAVGCGSNDNDSSVLNVGATAIPHSEILTQVVPVLEEQGITLEITVFDDFNIPNLALDAGDVDANFFQHVPFLENFNANNDTNLVPVFGVHFEPLRVYAGRLDSIATIPNGAEIAIPDDPTNEARALQLLEALGIIGLPQGIGLNARASDISYNPNNVTVTPLAAHLLPNTLPDVDFAIINGNVALNGGVIDLAIDGAGEDPASEAAQRFTNYIVVRDGDQNSDAIQALVNAINSPEIRNFIETNYAGRIVPQF